jgi:integrase
MLTQMKMPKGVAERWRKIYKGQTHYFRGTEKECERQWERKKVEIDNPKPAGWWYVEDGEPLEEGDTDLRKELGALAISPQDAWELLKRGELPLFGQPEPQAEKSRTIGKAVERFLARRKEWAIAGQMSVGHYNNLESCVNDFADHVGRKLGCGQIDEPIWESYCSELKARQKKGKSKAYLSIYQRSAKTFINWLWRMKMLKETPRNFKEKQLSFGGGAKEIETFTIPEVKQFLDKANERTKLYILLALNCGMTQIDISELAPDEVDWTNKRITRKRSKTKDRESTPTISYPLWSETFRLLRQEGEQTGKRVLYNDAGNALHVQQVGKSKIDNVRSAFVRLAKKHNLPTSFSVFRATSASFLDASDYANVARHFLGRAPRGVDDRNYLSPHTQLFKDRFDAAIRWLGEQYGLT